MIRSILCFFFLGVIFNSFGQEQPEFSTAGFYQIENSGRASFSMNPGWRFFKGSVQGAEKRDFDDKTWTVVNLPNGIEYLPQEASGGINYQGEIWYRKHFTPNDSLKGQKLFFHFEAIMGKSKIYVNGKLLKEHFGGYLPAIVDISNSLNWGEDNVIAVWADNSNDPSYPPGKKQELLDFTYFGGIYRDVWLIAHNNTYITNPNYENKEAGGGLVVAYDNVDKQQSDVLLKLQLRNEKKNQFRGNLSYELKDKNGTIVKKLEQKIRVGNHSAREFSSKFTLSQPHLWSPEDPYLYNLYVRISDKNGKVVDGYRKRIGIRSLEFKGKDGFWLNGEPYGKPLMGANRHQDFAVVGNAVPNNIHWKDAKKLKDAGLNLIRNTHYPQDPAFMDACDELGLFVIVNTPGWQFWNDNPIFEKRVFDDIRNMIRRDRNHASIFLWEPILNETWYPKSFAKEAKEIVEDEFPYKSSYSVCDLQAKGSEYFDILYTYPFSILPNEEPEPGKTYFTREWGDNVDNWNAHNSTSRVYRGWGEHPMLVQAKHYAKPDYSFISYDTFFKSGPQHVGGALWHAFDHQRGYHPDPFYGGLMDVYRQPKYSYFMFMAQRPAKKSDLIADTGPMVYIANEMTPFSSKDVTVYSNCDEVRLTAFKDGKEYTYKKDNAKPGMPSPPIVFKDVYGFMNMKAKIRDEKADEVFLKADGYVDGKLVASDTVRPAMRPTKIKLWLDDENLDLQADGSDFVTVLAAITDDQGNIKHLNNCVLKFKISGEGEILGNEAFIANPQKVVWGTAPILVKSTTKAGKITIKASMNREGSQRPVSGKLTFESVPATKKMLMKASEMEAYGKTKQATQESPQQEEKALQEKVETLQRQLNQIQLKKIEQQQADFGEKKMNTKEDEN